MPWPDPHNGGGAPGLHIRMGWARVTGMTYLRVSPVEAGIGLIGNR